MGQSIRVARPMPTVVWIVIGLAHLMGSLVHRVRSHRGRAKP